MRTSNKRKRKKNEKQALSVHTTKTTTKQINLIISHSFFSLFCVHFFYLYSDLNSFIIIVTITIDITKEKRNVKV